MKTILRGVLGLLLVVVVPGILYLGLNLLDLGAEPPRESDRLIGDLPRPSDVTRGEMGVSEFVAIDLAPLSS